MFLLNTAGIVSNVMKSQASYKYIPITNFNIKSLNRI